MTHDATGAMAGSGAYVGAGRGDATEGGRSSSRPGPDDARHDAPNWAWAGGNAHYDWMDHAPLFRQRD